MWYAQSKHNVDIGMHFTKISTETPVWQATSTYLGKEGRAAGALQSFM